MLDNGMFPQNGLFKDEDGNIVSIIALLKKISTDLGGSTRMIELQKSSTHIQWKYTDEEQWKDLVALSELKGAKGDTGKTGAAGAPGANGFGTEEQYNDIIRRLEALESLQTTATASTRKKTK